MIEPLLVKFIDNAFEWPQVLPRTNIKSKTHTPTTNLQTPQHKQNTGSLVQKIEIQFGELSATKPIHILAKTTTPDTISEAQSAGWREVFTITKPQAGISKVVLKDIHEKMNDLILYSDQTMSISKIRIFEDNGVMPDLVDPKFEDVQGYLVNLVCFW